MQTPTTAPDSTREWPAALALSRLQLQEEADNYLGLGEALPIPGVDPSEWRVDLLSKRDLRLPTAVISS